MLLLQAFSRSGYSMFLEEFQGWQRRSSGKFTIFSLVFLRKRRRWAVFKKHASGLGSTNLQNLTV
eukprot:UN25106